MGTSGGRIKQIYHPYTKWECYKNGMWEDVTGVEAERLLPLAIRFTSNHILYGEAMKKVVYSWKYSCEHFLTDKNTNRKAWLGHAACSLEHKLPENIVRIAWGKLTNEQRALANKEAEKYIKLWEKNHIYKQLSTQLNLFDEEQNRSVYQKLGEKMLLKRDSRPSTKMYKQKNQSAIIQKSSVCYS